MERSRATSTASRSSSGRCTGGLDLNYSRRASCHSSKRPRSTAQAPRVRENPQSKGRPSRSGGSPTRGAAGDDRAHAHEDGSQHQGLQGFGHPPTLPPRLRGALLAGTFVPTPLTTDVIMITLVIVMRHQESISPVEGSSGADPRVGGRVRAIRTHGSKGPSRKYSRFVASQKQRVHQ